MKMKTAYPLIQVENNFLFPGTYLTLEIEDSNLIGLVKASLKDNTKFVIFNPGFNNNRIGVIAEVRHFEKKSNNRYICEVLGLRRCKITKEFTLDQVHHVEINSHENIKENLTAMQYQVSRIKKILFNWASYQLRLNQKMKQEFFDHHSSAESIVNSLCVYFLSDMELKEVFLQCQSTADKIRMMDSVLKGESPESEDEITALGLKNFYLQKTPDIYQIVS